jgi:hypothetical protein
MIKRLCFLLVKVIAIFTGRLQLVKTSLFLSSKWEKYISKELDMKETEFVIFTFCMLSKFK